MPRKQLDVSHGKRCPTCEETKPITEFFRSAHTLHGLSVYCKTCTVARHTKWRRQNLPKMRAHSKKWRTENPRAAKDHILKSRYGIPLGAYDSLFAKQQGRCAICATADAGGRGDFHVDHSHETKEVRGLLCHNCNVGLGNFKSNGGILQQAIEYLLRYSISRT